MNSSNEIRAVGTSYVFILLPFTILLMVKGFTNSWGDLLLASDWSIASAMIYSSSIITVFSATNKTKKTINNTFLLFFIASTMFMAIVSSTIYIFVLLEPSAKLGVAQIVLFILASHSHFKYGRVAYRLQNTPES